jgi:hypothetical protein
MTTATRPNGRDELELHAPGGVGVSVRTRDMLMVLVVLMLAVSLGLVLWVVEQQLGAMTRDHAEMVHEMQIQSYLLSLPADQRPPLVMPPGLVDRLYRRTEPTRR